MSSVAETKAFDVWYCVELSVSWVVWPVALATLIVLGHRCYKNKENNFIESLPLLATQLNSVVIWSFLAASQVGAFNFYVNQTEFIKGDNPNLRKIMIVSFLENLIFL